MKIILKGDKKTDVQGERFIIQHGEKNCQKLHPHHPLCFIHFDKRGNIIDNVPFTKKETEKIKKFFEKIKI